MNSCVTKHTFWVILFISFCAVTPKILPTDDSCPCKPVDECSGDSQRLHTNSQVLILPCGSEDLIRCCSVIRKPIESADTTESLQYVDQGDQLAEENKEKEELTEETTRFAENTTPGVTHVDESLEEYTTTESSPTESPFEEITTQTTQTTPAMPTTQTTQTTQQTTPTTQQTTPTTQYTTPTTQIFKYTSLTNRNDTKDKNAAVSSTTEHIITTSTKQQRVPVQRPNQLRYFNWRQFPEPRPIRIRILNEGSTTPSSIIRLPPPEKPVRQPETREEKPEVRLDIEEQELIDRVINFESTKISKASYPKKRLASEIKETTEEKDESPVYKIRQLFPRNAIFNDNYRFHINAQKRF